MIVGVRGTLAAAGPDWVQVTVGGVTLQVFVPSSAIPALGTAGATVYLHTLLRIREEQPILYGFPDDASLRLFSLLTGVTGVGPRLGLALLSALDAEPLQLAVATGDVAALASAPGVGRRLASRIILELRGKVEAVERDNAAAPPSADGEVIAALAALGYSVTEARAAADAVPATDDLTVEDRIRLALQQFARR